MTNPSHPTVNTDKHNLARRLGLFDATMIVMGGNHRRGYLH
jgi:hypothetical protein